MNIQNTTLVSSVATEVAADALLAPAVVATVTPKLAAMSRDTAQAVAKGLVKAQVKHVGDFKKADGRLLERVMEAAKLAGVPLTEAQFDKQLAGVIRKALKAAPTLSAASLSGYASRFKAAVLALNSGDASLEPMAGETWHVWHARLAVALVTAKLPDGTPIRDASKARAGAKAGTPKAGTVAPTVAAPVAGTVAPMVAAPVAGTSKAKADDAGFNRSPEMAAALILTHQNEARAQRLVIALHSYPAEFDRWLSGIMSDADKAELEAKTAPGAMAVAMNKARAKRAT